MGKVAVVGFGCAGYHAALALRENSPDAVIHVYTDTGEAPYNPMLTTYYASDKIDEPRMFPFGNLDEIAARLRLDIRAGAKVEVLRAGERELVLSDKKSVAYDEIIICTGARALIPPIPGLPEHGVYAMRTAGDARSLQRDLKAGGIRSALIVGASMVGIKVAELLHNRGVAVMMADMAPCIFPLAALPETAAEIERRLVSRGLKFKFGSGVAALREDHRGIISAFDDGAEIPSDIVIFCMGTRANIDFVAPGELDTGRAIRVNLNMAASAPHIYAAGDCCEARERQTGESMSVGLWANAAVQGRIAGTNAAGGNALYQGNLIHNITHFLNMDFVGLGDNRVRGERIFFRHPREGWTLEAILSGGEMACVNLLDNAKLSGPLKNIFHNQFAASEGPANEGARLALLKSGLPAEIAGRLRGKQHD